MDTGGNGTGRTSARTTHPDFTYPFYGEAEQIYGYKDLAIDLSFAADSLLPLLQVKHTDTLGDDAHELEPELVAHLSADLHRDDAVWLVAATEESRAFAPHGECMRRYGCVRDDQGRETEAQDDAPEDDDEFEIWRESLANEAFRRRVDRMQIMSMFYIEGASLIDTEDDRFDVWTVYRRSRDGRRSFVGYCTCYRYNYYEPALHRMDVERYRISQFLVLPLYQRQGHGAQLYNAIVDYCDASDTVQEVTVEDPSPGFMRLRNRCDVLRLKERAVDLVNVKGMNGVNGHGATTNGEVRRKRQFATLAAGDDDVEAGLEHLQRKLKMAPIQLRRLVRRARRMH